MIHVMAGARRRRDLTDEQNEHVRVLVNRLLERTSQTALAPQLGYAKQGGLGMFISRRSGTSRSVAAAAAHLAGVDVEDVLAGRISAPLDPYPQRAAALAFLGDDVHPSAAAYVRTFEPKTGTQMTRLDWVKMLSYWDDLARRGQLP